MKDIKKSKRLFISFIFVSISLILFRPFIVNQLVARGDGYFGYGMYKDVLREYKKALILDPNNSKIISWLGYAYKCKGDKDNAIKTYKRAIEIDPKNLMAYHDLGIIYAMDKKFELAKECFLKAVSLPGLHMVDVREKYATYHRRSLEMLSICQEKLGETEDAIATCEKILEDYPQSEIAKERLKRLRWH